MTTFSIRRLALAMSAVVALALSACGNSAGPPPAGTSSGPAYAIQVTGQPAAVTVHETDADKFDPSSVSVAVGGVVEWTNTGSTPHNVTFDAGGPASPTMGPNDTFELKFTVAGTYHYACTFHQSLGMVGTVTVT